MDVGVLAVAGPGRAADTARRLEALGLHTVLFPDSQNLAPEVWGQLMLAEHTGELSEPQRRAILCENVAELYRMDLGALG